MAKARFVYRGADRTTESISRKAKQGGGLYDSYVGSEFPFFKAKEGEACVRILPPTWSDLEKWGDGWEIGVFLHYSVGPDNGAYLCLNKMKGEDCPVCEARRSATDEEEQDQLKPSYRSLCWVIDRDNEKAGPQVWSMPITLFREINTRSVDKKNNTPILVDDPEEGYDIVFNRAGTDMRTKYTGVEIMRDPSSLHDNEKQQARWLEYIAEHPLPDILTFFDTEHIEKVLYGKAERKRPDDVVEEAEPVSRSSRRRPVAEEVVEDEAEAAPSTPRRRFTEPETATEPTTSRRRQLLDAGEGEPEVPARGRRQASAEDAEELAPVRAARRSLERLKPSGRAAEGSGTGRRRPPADLDDEIPF